MAVVARQVASTNPMGSLHLATAPDTVAMLPQQPVGVKTLVAVHNSKLPGNNQRNTQKRSITVSSGKSPPPPPPPVRTTSRSVKTSYKEEVVLREKSPPPKSVRSNSVDRMERESSVERGKLSTASDGMTGNWSDDVGPYMRRRSHTESNKTSPARFGGKNNFNTIQWRGDVKFNPYTGATAHSMNGKFSASQPQLNNLEDLIAPNDRIKKSILEPGGEEEEEEGMGEDYGSGYRPTLMKISHGDIQKHAVAVTTPIVPPPTMNRFSSDSNILESQLDKPGMTRGRVSLPGVLTEDSKNSHSLRREEAFTASVGQVADSGIASTSIARAYREHLMEKMERKKHSKLGSSGSSSASPSPSISSAESNPQHHNNERRDSLSSKLRSITPSQLQNIDVPDRACYPKILPPASTSTDKKHEQPSEAVHNKGNPQNPFLLHSSPPMTSYDVPDMATYDALSRKKLDMNEVQRDNMSALKGPTLSLKDFNSAPENYALQQQRREWNQTDSLTKSLGSVESELLQQQAGMPAYRPSSSKSQASRYWSNNAHSASQQKPAPASSGLQPQHSSSLSSKIGSEATNRPPVLPKPTSRRRGSSYTLPPVNHERSTSDPTSNPTSNADKQVKGSSSPQPTAASRSGYNLDSQQQYNSGKQHSASSLLGIREADEGEEREKTALKKSRPTFADFVTLNCSSFPKRIRLRQDFSTSSQDVVLSQGDEVDLHFVRSVKSVLMADSAGVNYTAPLTSIAKFSPIYDPFGSEKIAMQGFHFKTAGILMDLRNPPSVVAATQSCNGGQAENSVEEGEVLVLQGIKNVFHGRLLKAFSLKHHFTKFLDETCIGNFTTSPDKLKISLTEIYETSIPLPQKVQFHSTNSILDVVNTSLQSDFAVLMQFLIEKSVIATTVSASSDSLPSSRSPSLSLSLNLNLHAQEVPVPENRMVQMQKRTQYLLDNFGKGPLIFYIDMPTTTSYMAQCALFLNLDPNLETDSSEILASIGTVSSRPNAKTVHKRTSNTGLTDANTKGDPRIQALEEKYSTLEFKVQEACKNMDKVSQKVDQIHNYLTKAQNAMNKHKKQRESERRSSQKTSQSSVSEDTKVSASSNSAPTSYSASTESSFSRSNSGQSRKLSSESESVDGGSERKSLNDDVFVRTNSISKPPVLPKPKELLQRRQNKTETRSFVAEAKRKLSLGEGTNETPEVSPRPIVAKARSSSRDCCHPPVDSYPTVLEANRRLSLEENSCQPKDNSHNGMQVKKRSSDYNLLAIKTENKPSVSIKPTAAPTKPQDDSIDLKDYLLDSNHGSTKGTSKSTSPKALPTTATPTSTTSTTTSSSTKESLEFMSIEALTEDLTDWCAQVEDELTKLYNDSILSAS